MIELLIVIGVLGILAVGLLAAVDPFEQLKKARDTNSRQAAISIQTALIRFYATHNSLPWTMTTPPTGCAALAVDTAVTVTAQEDCINGALVGDGELKADFVTALGEATADSMYISRSGAAAVSVCFSPASKSMFAEDTTKFSNIAADLSTAGGGDGSCDAAAKAVLVAAGNAGTVCYYCAK